MEVVSLQGLKSIVQALLGQTKWSLQGGGLNAGFTVLDVCVYNLTCTESYTVYVTNFFGHPYDS